ncbi:hypothetical protein H072_7294 [Dactylellina haptotyla CBS 200.50]|uniref:Major facilitator superfamily (MFS) profile domain-containing protein n=1 Tax=Dactylellina haptotyla (strain CBS 200.50) TaxID=1284197 RepID=S8A7F7_DACHA|nr:hypothetical protein H072_7294 [Dactylellina haptotyla CBS 200.50]
MDTKIDLNNPTADEQEKRVEKEFEAGADVSTANTTVANSERSNEAVSKEVRVSGEKAEDAVEIAGEPVDESAPPDGGYGWVCVACNFFMNACTWGINSSYGVYLSYYLTHRPPLFAEATSLDYAFVGGVTVGIGMVISPLANLLTRRFSSRVALLLGCVLQASSLIAASFAYKIWHLYLAQGALFGIGMGMIFVASVGILPQWFDKRRSVANGIAAAGSGIGGLAFSLGTNAMLQQLGLAWTFRITAIVAFVVNTTCSILVKDRNKKINPEIKMFDLKILKRFEFMYVVGWGAFSMLGYIVILYSLPNYGVSVGLTQKQGSIMGAMLNLGMAIGRPFVGLYSDSWGRINIAGALTFICSLTVFIIWINAKSFGVLIFFALINGAICGTFWTTVPPVTAEVVPLKQLPSALNLLWLFMIAPLTFSEPIGLALRETTWVNGVEKSHYLHPQIFAGFMYLAASVMMLLLRGWKIEFEDNLAGETESEKRFGKGRAKWIRWVKV